MKIAVSSSGRTIDSLLDARFGRCSYFIVYNDETKESKCIENKGCVSGSGAGIAAAQQMIDEDVDVVITGNLGPNAFNILKQADIKLVNCAGSTVEKAIETYKEGKLDDLNQSGPAHMGMGNGFRHRGGI